MIMKSVTTLITVLAISLFAASAFAHVQVNGQISVPPPTRTEAPTLDDQCTIAFQHYLYGSYSGTMTWPGHSGSYYLTAFCFSNSCTPDVEMCAYCIDLDHVLNQSPYCVNINDAVVQPPYPEQYPAMAYIMSWYPVADAFDDRVAQLSIWKLSTNDNCTTPGYGSPWYQIDAGRGYPNIGDAPSYPYVNTVYNDDASLNDPANAHVRVALGADDGMPKNVIMSGDQLQLSSGPATVNAGISTTPVTITLVRGAHALSDGNSICSGVRLQINADYGTLSDSVVFTNGSCQAQVTVSQPIDGILHDVHISVCSQGLWPEQIVDCNHTDCEHVQELVAQSQGGGSLVRICQEILIPGDEFLSVELAGFDVAAGDGTVALRWGTASETRNDHFEIQRDGVAIAEIATKGNGAAGHSYGYSDDGVNNGTLYHYALLAVDVTGARVELRSVQALPNASAAQITSYALHQNYPNPFNPTTTISFDILESGFTSLKVYNLMGQEVAALVNRNLTSGRHTVSFDGVSLPSGVYLYRLNVNGFVAERKMLLMK
jgi:hypothetical protein